MGQKLRDDKIGSLSHSSGVITMAASTSVPAWLTIGGQQYKITSNIARTIATDVTLAAHTLYMVYAVRNSGNIELRITTNVNSIGPVGFLGWKLIGAFYSNNLVSIGFGGFVNIDGVPESEWWVANSAIGSSFLTGSSGNPSYGTVQVNIYKLKRVGDHIVGQWDYRQNAAGTTGSGAYYIKQPFQADLTLYKPNPAQTFVGRLGEMSTVELTSGAYVGVSNVYIPGNFPDQLSAIQGLVNGSTAGGLKGDWGSSFSHFAVAEIIFGLRFDYKVSGWTKTPLKDL